MSFDSSKPPFQGLLISADHRANFFATERASFINAAFDPLFENWPETDSDPLGTWALAGTGATIARDTTAGRFAVGAMGARVTFGSTIATLSQNILDAASYDDFFDAKIVTAGVSVHASAIGIADLQIDDGASQLESATNVAANALEFLTLEKEINAAATQIALRNRVIASGDCTFSGAVFLFSNIKPPYFLMPMILRRTLTHEFPSLAAVGEVNQHLPGRPFIVEEVQLNARTAAPTGQPLIADVNQFDGATLTSMFSTRPQILAGASPPTGGAVPDGVYNRKCFAPYFGNAAFTAGQQLQSSIDQIGSTLPGEDLAIHIRYKTWLRPQELFIPGAAGLI